MHIGWCHSEATELCPRISVLNARELKTEYSKMFSHWHS